VISECAVLYRLLTNGTERVRAAAINLNDIHEQIKEKIE
jgi:hypothetical protein